MGSSTVGKKSSSPPASPTALFNPDPALSCSFLQDRPPFHTALEPPRRSVPANVKTVEIEWLDDDDDVPAHLRAHSSAAQPRIEDVTSSIDPEVLDIPHRQNVCVVEMPSAVEPPRILNAHTQRNLFNPNAPVITDVSQHINDE